MASNDKRTLINRLSGTAGKGAGANTGLGTADVLIPEFPKLPSRITEETARQFRQDVERWRVNLQGQFPIPIPTPEAYDPSGLQSQIDSINSSVSAIKASIGSISPVVSDECNCTKADIGLGNADNTSDVDKPISVATQAALDLRALLVHQHPLSQITQSGAYLGQIPVWDGAAWVPQNSPATVPLEITAFSSSVASAELGSSVSSITFNWSYNTSVTSQSISGVSASINVSLRTITHTSPVSSTTTFTLSGSDGTFSASSSVTLTFYLKRYWGVSGQETLNSTEVLALAGNEFSPSLATSKTITAANQYIFFAYPTSQGQPVFSVNGMRTSGWKSNAIQLINASGYESSYTVYRSEYKLTGTYNISVS